MWLKAKNILLACVAVAFVPLRRRAAGAPQRILIVQNAKLGDMVCTTPLFRAIKKNHPAVRLTVMGSALNRELLAGHPYVDEYVQSEPKFFTLVRTLKRGQFDVAAVIGPDPQLLAALICARIPEVVVPRIPGAASPYETSVYKFLSTFVTTVDYHLFCYAPREYLRLLEPLDIYTDDVRKELAVSPDAVLRVKEMLKKKGVTVGKDFIVGVAPSAGAIKLKSWGAERFAKVAEHLIHKHNAVIAVIAGKGERKDVDTMLRALPAGARVLDFCGVLSIEELKALVSLLSLFISSDTGPVHIAEAFGIPTVNVLGAVDERETFLAGPRSRVVFDPQRGAAELHVLTSAVYDPKEVRRQTDLVTVGMVIAAVEDLLKVVKGAQSNPA